MARRQRLFVSLPHGLPTAVAGRSREAKAIAILYCLKAVHVGGYIPNYHRRADEIANSFGFGRSKLLCYVKVLIELGFAKKVGKALQLVSSKKVARHYGCCPPDASPAWVPKFYRLPFAELDRIELHLRELAIAENVKKQQYAVAKKEATKYLLTRTTLPFNPTPAARRRALRGYDPAVARRASTSLCESNYATTGGLSAINPVCTLSRQGIARLFGRRSARTGTRWARKLKSAGLLTDTISRLRIKAMSLADFQFARSQGIFSGAYSWWKGFLYRRLPNVITCPLEWLEML